MLILAEPAVYTKAMHYYEVAPTKIVRAGQPVLTYCSNSPLAVGQLVTIPVGKTSLVGVVVQGVAKPAYDTKPVTASLDIPPLPATLLETTLWMSDYYATPLATVLQTILPRGVNKTRRALKPRATSPKRDRTNFVFNQDQLSAIKRITEMTSGSALLHGVTGSGKTAVYIELAKQALARNESVLILVPEIALTGQLVAEFQNHFGNNIILTHSRQTEAERHTTWLQALRSVEPRIVIGPRSALFMPLKNIRLIVIDEAHEPSYKQDQSPRYSALRVASVIAAHTGGKVIQGSATPLISEYFLAEQSGRPVIHMPNKARINASTPEVTLIDMTKKTHFLEHRLLSDELLKTLRETLEQGKQSLIFHNRRGSASTTLCEQCGWSALCSRCFVPYTLHADLFNLTCHICGNTSRVPTSCPECHSTDIIHKGIGTKLIESELRKLFPKAVIARFDGDTANNDTVESRYNDLYSGAIDIIIGTQVIAKGLDLPHLQTVGVVQADAGLSLPDYSSSERTFQLLAQVVGRVGRAEHSSKIIIQSYQPNSPAVQLGIIQNYADFYTATLAERKRAIFPPYTYLLKLTCVYKTEAATIRNAQKLAAELHATHKNITILGPTPAFYERQHDTYRWQIVVKSQKRAALVAIAKALPQGWHYDLDPMSLL